MKKEKILVIGASGQIGVELTLALRKIYGGSQVIASDLREENELLKGTGPYVSIDVMNKEMLHVQIIRQNITQVYLLAAMLSATGEKNPPLAWNLNMQSLLNVLDIAKEEKLHKVYWPSSIAVFGPTSPKLDCPQQTIIEPTTVYGISKYAGEFINGKPHGLGAFHSSNGIISEGVWADGKFIRSALVQQATTSSTLSNSAEIDRLSAEVEVERKKRQELEAQLASSVQPPLTQSNAPRLIAHALVIGNAAYSGSGRLENPVNDANAISQKLRSMGFTVTTVTDANRQRLVQSMAQFRRTAASADISLLYYAGHGVQIFGTNYILPTDVDQTDPAQATIQGVSLNSVVENFLPGKTKLVFLDACRDNALQRTNDRSVSKGLAPISAAQGTLISYATKDGQTAADGVGSKNSPFTQALLEHLNDPQDIAVVLRKVRERVMKITGGKQQPWEYGSLTGGELVLSAIKPK